MAATKPKIAAPDGKRKVLAPVRPNVGLQAEYQRRLDTLIAEMQTSVTHWVRATYRRNPPELAQDSSAASDLAAEMATLGRRWLDRFADAAVDLGRWFATSAATRSDATMRAILGRAGWTVRFKPTRAWNAIRTATINANVQLIKSIPADCLAQVQGITMRAVQEGRDLGYMTQELQKQFGITFRRAAFISRDQNEKATAAITRVRQLELGIVTAQWRHSAGGKEPRPTHVKAGRDREVYDIQEGWLDPALNRRIWPGTEINCRCVAQPIIDALN